MRQAGGLTKRAAYRTAVQVLRVINPGDVTIRHHWTGAPLRLHSFRHKGYWVHGANRERPTMVALARLLQPGDVVFDVGGHIGYLSMWMADLVGPSGRVVAFEPGPNNLPYLRTNLRSYPHAEIVEQGLSSSGGTSEFLVEDLTGQNNSLLTDGSHLHGNERTAGLRAKTANITIGVTTLDDFVAQRPLRPALVKVDVEGAELEVLRGGDDLLTSAPPVLVVEISRQAGAVRRFLEEHGYQLYLPALTERLETGVAIDGNVVCLHHQAHSELRQRLGFDR